MPTYDYRCESCGETVELSRKINQRDWAAKCDRCMDNMIRLPAAPGLVFKGPGFYQTDYKNKRPPKGGAQ